MEILFFGKRGDICTGHALNFLQRNAQVTAHFGRTGDRVPWSDGALAYAWKADCIINYLGPWILPDWMVEDHKAINFHPGPPEYPGTGCVNYALYDKAKQYGATCHFMAPSVDTGPIIQAVHFDILESDTVKTLLDRTYAHMLALFYTVTTLILSGTLPSYDHAGGVQWTGTAHTRAQLNALATITPGMSRDEVERRIRATSYGDWQPAVVLHGYRFELMRESDNSSLP